MIRTKGKALQPLPKLATGIAGFDQMSRGGLPRHRTSLLVGGPGAGKTVFALQCLVNAARLRRTRGVFVAFEENPVQIIANGATFDWGLAKLAQREIFFLNAQLSPTLVNAGSFDLTGMLAILAAKINAMGAEWIVFDGIDVLLTLLQDPGAEMREIYRIRDWLVEHSLTAIVTAKIDDGTSEVMSYGFLQFMVDCVVRFERRQQDRISAHSIQIAKYRGSGFAAAEFPVSFGPPGIEIGGTEPAKVLLSVSGERITAGFKRLDTMLGGGVYRGSSTLVTGVPGTAKTTLAGKFAEAACRRGERTLFVSYDEAAAQIVRNISSVGIQLKEHVNSGLLRLHSARMEGASAEEHLLNLKALIDEYQPRCMVIDPLTAISKTGTLGTARAVANRLIYMIKDRGITLLVTAPSETGDPRAEATDLQISTIVDTWIHLSYLVQSGERNRVLTIVKSRGTRHSNQVRELVLSKGGVTLADVYSAGGEVLMGTLRWEKEAEERVVSLRRHGEMERKWRKLQVAEAPTSAKLKDPRMALQRQSAELALYADENAVRSLSTSERDAALRKMRSADAPDLASKPKGNGTSRQGRRA